MFTFFCSFTMISREQDCDLSCNSELHPLLINIVYKE